MKNLKLCMLFAMFVAIGLMSQASAQVAFHGISFLKGAESPVEVGAAYQSAFVISNTVDTAQDTLHVTSLIDTVQAASGDVTSANILDSLTWTLSGGAQFIGPSHLEIPFGGMAVSDLFTHYTVVEGDFFLPSHVLVDTAQIIWHDTCDHNSTNCNGLDRTSDTVSQATVTAPLPCATITKKVNCDKVVRNPAGEEVTYTYTVHNCSVGTNQLILGSIFDDKVGEVNGFAETAGCFPIAPGGDCTFDVPFTIPGNATSPFVNTVTGTFIDQFGQSVTTDPCSASVTIIDANFTVTKQCTSNPIPASGIASFLVTITNISTTNTDLIITNITDPGVSGIPAFPFTVKVGDPCSFTVTKRVDCATEESATNTITVSANVADDLGACDINDITHTAPVGNPAACFCAPKIKVDKQASCDTATPGQVITYTITIENISAETLTLDFVHDTLLGDITANADANCGTLASGATCSFDVTRAVKASDVSPLVNVVDVNYFDAQGQHASDTNMVSIKVIHPNFTVTKTCVTDPFPTGGPATFQVVVTNIGDVNLSFTTDEVAFIQPPITEPFELAKNGGSKTFDVNVPAGTSDVTNTITVTATLVDEPECTVFDVNNVKRASDICHAPQGGITRTWGFWAQHCDFTSSVFACCGSIDLGWINVTTDAQLFGVFRMHNDKKGCPGQNDLCSARIQASVQALAAILNTCMQNGDKNLPVSEPNIAAILKGCDIQAIKDLGDLLGAFNESNDTGTALDCNGNTQGKADGGCAKTKGTCQTTPCNAGCAGAAIKPAKR